MPLSYQNLKDSPTLFHQSQPDCVKIIEMKKLRLSRVIPLVAAVVLILIAYLVFASRRQTLSYFEFFAEEQVAYKDLTSVLDETPRAFFFCTESNADCRYIDTKMIRVLIEDANTSRFDHITLVDTATMNPAILPSVTKATLGFAHIPAFAILSYRNDKIIVHAVLEWTTETPFTSLNLKDWMKENDLWLNEYTN